MFFHRQRCGMTAVRQAIDVLKRVRIRLPLAERFLEEERRQRSL